MAISMTEEELLSLVREELKRLLTKGQPVRYELIGVMAETFAQRTDLQAILERIDAQGQQINALREDFNRQFAQQPRRMDQVDRRLDRLESTVSGLGARWGMMAESAFREGQTGVLEGIGWQVKHYRKVDTRGIVFTEPDQVEIDLAIQDGVHTLIEIKSSVSRGDVEHFHRKIAFYEQEEDVEVGWAIIISPTFGPAAKELAQMRGMDVYTSIYDVPRP